MFLISQIRIYPQFFHGLCTFTIDVYSIYFRSDVDVPSGWHCSPVQVTLYIVRRAENRFGNSGKIGKVIFQLRDQTRRGNWIVLYTVCCFFFFKVGGDRMRRETRNLSFRVEIYFVKIIFHFNFSNSSLFPLPIDRRRFSVAAADIDIFIAWFKHEGEWWRFV